MTVHQSCRTESFENRHIPFFTKITKKAYVLLSGVSYYWCILLMVIGLNSAVAETNTKPANQSPPSDIDRLCNWASYVGPTKIVSWNAYSRQFIDPPTFKLLPMPKVVKYTAQVQQGEQTWTIESDTPILSLTSVWPQMKTKLFTLNFKWIDKLGNALATENSIRVKAPDWQGLNEPDANWLAAADRNMNYLIYTAWQGQAPYSEPNVPLWIWSCASPTVTPKPWVGSFPNGLHLGYPCITINNYIWGLLAYIERNGPKKEEALHLARLTADWGLKNRRPDHGALPLFPYSTISNGQFSGGNEGDHVNLLRASWLGLSYVDLYRATDNHAYLDYARHIAQTTMKYQRADGSFPYRIHPETGAVSEYYTPAAVEFAILARALEPFCFNPDLAMAAQRAINWTINYVCTSNHWKAVYEDVATRPHFSNLSGYEIQILIHFLCRYKDENPAFVPLARSLNRFLEDQFVLFGPESEAFIHPTKKLLRMKGPLVFEQFTCWYPMDGHTGFWIQTLIELHKATGNKIYLDKARAAANAICALQFDDGQFSTFGMRYYREGTIVSDAETGFNWYNCNAIAAKGLYALDKYLKSIPRD